LNVKEIKVEYDDGTEVIISSEDNYMLFYGKDTSFSYLRHTTTNFLHSVYGKLTQLITMLWIEADTEFEEEGK
jgi:hypothetical protein